MRDLLSRLDKAQGRFVPLADGSFLALTEQFRKQLERLSGISEDHGKGRRMPILAGVAAQDLAGDAGQIRADKEWKAFVERLSEAGRRQPEPPRRCRRNCATTSSRGFAGCRGWRIGRRGLSGRRHGTGQDRASHRGHAGTGASRPLSGDRADLGLSQLGTRTDPLRPEPRGPAPRRGGRKGRILAGLKAMDVLILSYGLLHQEADRLADIDWRMIVFDEAQAIKNADTRRAQAGQRLKAHFRVALTGTPIENYLEELWSLFAVINPGLLGSREHFGRRFVAPIERNRDAGALHALRALIRPFMLRRTKSAVLSELPPRTEVTLEIELPEDERAFYEAMRQRALETLAELSEKRRRPEIAFTFSPRSPSCAGPAATPASSIPPRRCPAPSSRRSSNSSTTSCATNTRRWSSASSSASSNACARRCCARGISHQYLDGGTPAAEREKRVAAFQAGQGDLFLISLRAGGTGLNLTAADYVIHLDPWWNPAVEDQASDRAHRIGQQRPVTVYRLIVRNSIEEKILDLHRSKRDLASDLLEGTEVSAKLSDEDLLNLMRA